jgi:hypothetical protein
MKIISNKSISLPETIQSSSTRPKVPMTLDDFKRSYNELLNFHLNEYIDHSELTFAQIWTDAYSNLSSLLQRSTEPKLLTAVEKRGLEALKKKQYYHNLELSFNEIRKFLKQRIKVVKKELKAKPEPPVLVEIVNPDAVKKQPDSKIHFSIMNDAILSFKMALIEDRKTFTVDIKQEQTYVPKPCFKPESIDSIITTLKDFFDSTEHIELRRIIEAGSNANEKLLFKDNGNKLTDCFRELFNNNTITGCTKTVLINWIIDNFNFTNGSSKKDYSFANVEKVISSKYRLCKNPII